ncbi:MAG TPA: DUF2147 domain-containing protein [Variovorax sp.]
MSMSLPSPSSSRRALAAICLLLAAFGAQSQSAPPSDPRGRWITASGNLEVEIAPCGDALCGTVTRVLANRSMEGGGAPMQPVDTRPALGMTLLRDFRPAGVDQPPTQWAGELYNRENGTTYSCNMSMDSAGQAPGELVLHPYVGLPLFGKTQRWLRAAAN